MTTVEDAPPDSPKKRYALSREQFDKAITTTIKALELRINGQKLNGEARVIDRLYLDLEKRTMAEGLLKNSRRIPQIHNMLNAYQGEYIIGAEFTERLIEFRNGLANIRNMSPEEAGRYLTACQAYFEPNKNK